MAEHFYSYEDEELTEKFDSIINETLGEIDINHAFDKTIGHPKVTGIAGDVIEQSVLGYPSNSDQKPDIFVSGLPVEVKTTGIRYSTKARKSGKATEKDFEAKEPMSITAVSPDKIVDEEFDNSNFWHKLERMLLVYYHYDADKPVKSWDYKNFMVKGYELHQFSKEDKKRLEADWVKVRDFIREAKLTYPNNPTVQYPFLGSTLRKDLLLIDTAPKWPHNPRFRLKRSTVTAIVQEYFENRTLEKIDNLESMNDVDKLLHDTSEKYRGKTVREILEELGIKYKLNSKKDVSKSIAEQIVLKMFNSKSKKLNEIEVFNKAGFILKSLVQTKKHKRTEDTKLFSIDFSDLSNEHFGQSQFFEYFYDTQFLFILFEEPSSSAKLLDNKFLGFKRLYFEEEFIDTIVKKAWNHTRDLVINNKLKESIVYRKNTNEPVINKKSGTVQTTLNFIKSKDNEVFIRGGGKDSTAKNHQLNGISMYQQFIWIKGSYINNRLNELPFI